MTSSIVCANTACGKTLQLNVSAQPGLPIACPACKQVMTVKASDHAKPATECSLPASPSAAETLSLLSPPPNQPSMANVPSSSPADPGTSNGAPKIIGRFQIRRFLGEGAFGAVFEGFDPQLDRSVAIKVAKLGQGDSEKRVKRFLREAKAAAGLRHPNIVPVYEFGQEGDQFYIVSAFIKGFTLQESLKEQQPPSPDLPRARRIVRKLADALAYAHGQGIVHRDVKPANVMLDDQDEPLLMDFGLATRQEEAEKLTHAGAILGTPLYMAPEQARGDESGALPASDQYSLGVMLFEMITGQPPFTGTPEIVMFNHVDKEPPRPSKRNASVSRDLETICLKCLEKLPERRYATMHLVAEDLRRLDSGEPIVARPVGTLERLWRWSRRKPAQAGLVGVAVLLLMVLAGGAASLIYSAKVARERDRAEQLQNEFDYARSLLLARLELEAGNQARAAEILDECNWSLRGWEWQHLRRNSGLVNTIEGQGVRTVCISPDGQRLASGCFGTQIWLWEEPTGKVLRAFEGHKAQVTSVCFSPDGQFLASGSEDKTLRIWNAQSGEVLHVFSGHSGNLNSICFSPDGRVLAASGEDHSVRRWDVRTGEEMPSLQGHKSHVRGVCFSPDGKQLLSGSDDKTACVWDARTGHSLRIIDAHSSGVSCVCFSPDGNHMVTVGSDRKEIRTETPGGSTSSLTHISGIRLWDARTGKELRTFEGHTARIRCVSFSPDGTRLASGSEDRTARIWDVRTGKNVRSLRSADKVESVCFSPDGQRLVCGNWLMIRVWDARIDQESRVFRGHLNGLNSIAFSPDGERLTSAASHWSGSGELIVWDVASGQAALNPTLPDNQLISSVSFSPDGSMLVSANGTFAKPGEVQIRDAQTGNVHRTIIGHNGEVACVCVSPDGSLLASSSKSQTGKDKTVRLWDFKTGDAIRELEPENAKFMLAVDRLCFSPDGTRLAGAGVNSNAIYVWDVHTGKEIFSPTPPGRLLHGGSDNAPLSFSPDGQKLAVTAGSTLHLWDTKTGKLERAFHGHTGKIFAVGFSPDGTRLASGGDDWSVRLWDVRTGSELLTLRGHTDLVSCVSFSPDGQRLASGSQDKTVRLWDARSTQALRTLRGLDGHGMMSVSFSQDRQRIVARAGLEGKQTLAWNLKTGQRLPVCVDPPPPLAPQLEAKNPAENLTAWIAGHRGADGRPTVWNVERVFLLRQEDGNEATKNDLAIGREWHLQQVIEAEKSKAWFAAALHRECISMLLPTDQKSQELAVAAWKKAGDMERAARVANRR